MSRQLNGSERKNNYYRIGVISMCAWVLLACGTTQSLQSKSKQQFDRNEYISNDVFCYNGSDTLVHKEDEFRIVWQTKDYQNNANLLRKKIDSIYFPWTDNYAYSIIQYLNISQETRNAILEAGGLQTIMQSILSQNSFENAHRNGNPIAFEVLFIVSLADMKILEYGFELSWNDKNLQLTSEEMKNILDFIHTIQLTYSGGEKFRDETIAFGMNLHRLR